MLTRLLGQLGVFMGARKTENEEALFFYEINKWMLAQAYAEWINSSNFLRVDATFRDEMIRVADYHLRSFKSREFVGIRNFLRYRDIRQLDFPWGWKDPYNTLTIDIWKELFPRARLLHIYRNPIDVAESLRNREKLIKRDFHKWIRLWRGLSPKEIFLVGNMGYFRNTTHLLEIRKGISLWEEYLNKAVSMDGTFGSRLLHVRYESFLEKPEEILKTILDHIGLKADDEAVSQTAQTVNRGRRYAFLGNKELLETYRQIKDTELMRRLDYSNIEEEVANRF